MQAHSARQEHVAGFQQSVAVEGRQVGAGQEVVTWPCEGGCDPAEERAERERQQDETEPETEGAACVAVHEAA